MDRFSFFFGDVVILFISDLYGSFSECVFVFAHSFCVFIVPEWFLMLFMISFFLFYLVSDFHF